MLDTIEILSDDSIVITSQIDKLSHVSSNMLDEWLYKSIDKICVSRVCDNIYKNWDILCKNGIFDEPSSTICKYHDGLLMLFRPEWISNTHIENDYNMVELYNNGMYDECKKCPCINMEIQHELLYGEGLIHNTPVDIIFNVRSSEEYVKMLGKIYNDSKLIDIMEWYCKIYHEIVIQYYNDELDMRTLRAIYNMLIELDRTDEVMDLIQYYYDMI